MLQKPRILYAVLHWGLGHATRSIPIINQLLAHGFEVVIASDGLALEALTTQFPELETIKLPPLNITYSGKKYQSWAMMKQFGSIMRWHFKERKYINRILAEHRFDGIVSDNRPAIHGKGIPSAYITHQINVYAGIFTPLATALHAFLYKAFTSIWVPDYSTSPGLSGALGHPKRIDPRMVFIGPQSDLTISGSPKQEGIGVILSGPEPQRTQLENAIIKHLSTTKNVTLIRGTKSGIAGNLPSTWKVINLASRADINHVYNTCEVLISRTGYSTLMDLEQHPKPAVLIPTPGQPEQEYLAQMVNHKLKYAIQTQDRLEIIQGIALAKTKFNTASTTPKEPTDWSALFSLFKRK